MLFLKILIYTKHKTPDILFFFNNDYRKLSLMKHSRNADIWGVKSARSQNHMMNVSACSRGH
jgi:hypothetical protein